MATNKTTKTLTWQEMDAMATEVVRYLLVTPNTQALSAWSAALHAVDYLHEMDRTWPLVAVRLERAAFERSSDRHTLSLALGAVAASVVRTALGVP